MHVQNMTLNKTGHHPSGHAWTNMDNNEAVLWESEYENLFIFKDIFSIQEHCM